MQTVTVQAASLPSISTHRRTHLIIKAVHLLKIGCDKPVSYRRSVWEQTVDARGPTPRFLSAGIDVALMKCLALHPRKRQVCQHM